MISSSSTTYATPDMAALRAAKATINNQGESLTLSFLPTMAAKLKHLRTTVNRADGLFRDELRNMAVNLDNTGLKFIDIQWQQVETAPNITPQQRKDALAKLVVQRARSIKATLDCLQKAERSIAGAADDVEQIELTFKDDSVNQGLLNEINQLTARDAALQKELDEVTEQRKALAEAMAVYEKYNVADLFKDMLPTANELKGLKATSAEIALIQAAIQRVARALGKISDGLNYKDLAGRQDTLRDDYNRVLSDQRLIKSKIEQAHEKSAELVGLATTEQSRKVWFTEVQKVSGTLKDVLANLPDLNDAAAVGGCFERLKQYLDSFAGVTRPI